MKLTKRMLSESANSESATELPNGITERLSNSIPPKRAFQVRLRRKGFPIVCRTFTTLKKAKVWQRQSLAKIDEGQSVATFTSRRFTVADAIDDYVADQTKKNGTGLGRLALAREEQRLIFLRDQFEEHAVANLTPDFLTKWREKMLKSKVSTYSGLVEPTHDDVAKWDKKLRKRNKSLQSEAEGAMPKGLTDWQFKVLVSKLSAQTQVAKAKVLRDEKDKTVRTRSEGTVRKYFYTLKKVLEWHSQFRKYPFASPFLIVTAPSEDNHRTRRLEDGEEAKLLEACDKSYVNQEAMKRIVGIAIETAMRLGELLKIEVKDVELAQRRIVVRKELTKTKKERQVPLSVRCIALLNEQLAVKRTKDQTRVFFHWKNSNAFGHRFKCVVNNANLLDFRFHDLRHEATSRFYEKTNLTDLEIASITGHSDLRTLMRYANLRSNHLADKLDKGK